MLPDPASNSVEFGPTGDPLQIGSGHSQLARCLALTRAIGRARLIDDVYSLALDALADGLGTPRASLLLFDRDHVMRFKAYRCLSEAYRRAVEGHSPWLPNSPDAEPIIVPDVAAESSLTEHLGTLEAEGVVALAFVPLVVRGLVIGKFVVYFDVVKAPSAEEIQLAQVTASLVAFAVEHLRAEQQAHEASQLKDQFLATLSHELRTPMNAILGWAQLLKREMLPSGQISQGIEVIERNAKLQAQLIEDLLDVSRIVSGKLELGQVPVSVGRVIDNVVSGSLPTATAKRIVLAKSIEGCPLVVGDAERLEQVLSNVISNALKFTPSGGRVDVRCRGTEALVEIEVCDTGKGILPEFLPYVFDRFRQADSRSTRGQGGLGLGLAIARHLVHRHRGDIRAYSAGEGKGATITIQLPAVSIESQRAAPAARTVDLNLELRIDDCRVVVVDDQQDSREILAAVLQGCGANVVQCVDAVSALDELGSFRPHLLVADLAMPGVDGFDLIRLAREQNMALPAIAVSAYARTEDRAKALSAGFTDYCTKPIVVPEFLRVVRKALLGTRTNASTSEP